MDKLPLQQTTSIQEKRQLIDQLAQLRNEIRSQEAVLGELRQKLSLVIAELPLTPKGMPPGIIGNCERRGQDEVGTQQDDFEFPPEVTVSFDANLRGLGWHPVEFQSDNTPFRWSGPTTTSIVVVDLPRHIPFMSRVDVVNAMRPDYIQTIGIAVDGVDVLVNANSSYFEFLVPASVDPRIKEVEVTFSLLETLKPSVVSSSTDERSLGIAVSVITFTPVLNGLI